MNNSTAENQKFGQYNYTYLVLIKEDFPHRHRKFYALERFIKLSRDYELEQTNLTNLVEHLRQEVKEQEKQKVNVRQFIAAVRKYTDMQQLDASVLREFVEKIYISEVYTPDENEPRIKVREIEIVYNFIGAFDFEEAREQSQADQKDKKTGVA